MPDVEPSTLSLELRTGFIQRALHDYNAEITSFGPYHLFRRLRRLERGGSRVPLGDRAFDILCVLTERAGEIVPNRDLMARVWGRVVVGDSSLRFHINALRKTLARHGPKSEYIRNVARRGYVFTAPVRGVIEPLGNGPGHAVELGSLPRRPTDIVGREAEIRDLIGLLSATRFVTIVGPVGIGKTTVALEVAYQLRESFDTVGFVDFEAPGEPSRMASAAAAAVGLVVPTANPGSNLKGSPGDKRVLLILDSCERVPELTAKLSEQILEVSGHIAILVTSQEALRADGERIYNLGPLGTPCDGSAHTPEDALKYPAIQLFVARARAAFTKFQLAPSDIPHVAALCTNVGGIPLAIELAAGRVGTLALPTIVKLLNTPFALSWHGRRTAPERHRTLGAAITRTAELLDDCERAVLRRLSAFAGPFTLEGAQYVAGGAPVSGSVTLALSNLVAKSLVSSTRLTQSTHFRLPKLIRTFAIKMLEESGESTSVERRHAILVGEFVEEARSGAIE